MEGFKKKLQGRQVLLTTGLIGACAAIGLTHSYANRTFATEHMQSFVAGFQVGIIIVILGVLVYFFLKNMMAIRDPERMKKLYIYETDERRLFIRQKSDSAGMNIAMFGLAVGTVVAGNINDIAFIALLCASLFVSVVRVALKLYYRNKF